VDFMSGSASSVAAAARKARGGRRSFTTQ
jgi:hypothetical protein